MQVQTRVFVVKAPDGTKTEFDSMDAAAEHQANTPGSQIQTRPKSRTVPAAFAVFKGGEMIGKPFANPGKAAKAAAKCGGQVKLVPQTNP